MANNWNRTLTIFSSSYISETKITTWKKFIVHNCFYGETDASSFASLDMYKANTTIARIPPQTMSLSAGINSYVFLGEVFEDIEDNTSGKELFQKYSGFIVNAFHDNTNYLLPHYFVSGAKLE